MKFWVGVTDNTWFDYLAAREVDETNFWQPSATPPFKGAPIDEIRSATRRAFDNLIELAIDEGVATPMISIPS